MGTVNSVFSKGVSFKTSRIRPSKSRSKKQEPSMASIGSKGNPIVIDFEDTGLKGSRTKSPQYIAGSAAIDLCGDDTDIKNTKGRRKRKGVDAKPSRSSKRVSGDHKGAVTPSAVIVDVVNISTNSVVPSTGSDIVLSEELVVATTETSTITLDDCSNQKLEPAASLSETSFIDLTTFEALRNEEAKSYTAPEIEKQSFSEKVVDGIASMYQKRSVSQVFDRKTSRSRFFPPASDIEAVKLHLDGIIHSQIPKDSSLQCAHLSTILSEVFLAIKSETRKEFSESYQTSGKTCYTTCPECNIVVCLGCGQYIDEPGTSNGDQTGIHYCVNTHLLSVILILARIDSRWILKEHSPAKLKSKKLQTPNNSPYSRLHTSPGIGYGSGQHQNTPARKSIDFTVVAQEKLEDDRVFTQMMGVLESLFVDEYHEFTVVSLLAEKGDIVTSFIKVSYLAELIRSLVRNDSIMDIDSGNGWDLYSACLNVIRAFADHDNLLSFLITALQEKKSSPGIASLVKYAGEPVPKARAKGKKRASLPVDFEPVEFIMTQGFEGVAQPIDQSFDMMVKQCQAFMKNASFVRPDENDEDTYKIIDFCTEVDATAIKLKQRSEDFRKRKELLRPRRITSAMSNAHLANLSPEILSHPIFASSRRSKEVATANPLEIPSDIKQACKDALGSHLQFKFSTDVVTTHCSGATMDSTTAASPGRMRRLIKELTVLSTTLPSGIFVRVQEDRPDLFKVIIVGPDATPYELGLYEFDFTIPSNYPNEPPTVLFKTTGGGRVRFNPNLYNCGKVCLSILGTWEGVESEKWQAGKSTLLQVLVSIQAMILCAEPYYNEPGHEVYANSPASKNYNENVQFQNLRVAMGEWLSYDGVWNDVVQAHFLARATDILTTATRFAGASTEKNFSVDIGGVNNQDFGYDDIDGANPSATGASTAQPTLKVLMGGARKKMQKNLEDKLPDFTKKELWKEKVED